MHVHSFEGWLQCAELVEHDADGPDVTLERVGSALYDLWREVVRRAHHRPRHIHSVPQHPGNAKVPNLDQALLGQEYVLALDVAMQYLSVVDVLHAEANLGEPVQDLVLRKIPSPLLLYLLGEVAAIGKVHDDAKVTFFGLVRFPESHDVGMVEYFEDLRLLQRLNPFFFTHF